MKTKILAGITMLLVLLNAGCTQQTNQGTDQTDGKTVIMKNFALDPVELTIKTGDTVVWINKDSVPYNLVAELGSEPVSPTIQSGRNYSHTFNTAGEYVYHDEIHGGMKGKIIVK